MTMKHENTTPGEGRDEPLIAPLAIEVERSETEGAGGAINGSSEQGVDRCRRRRDGRESEAQFGAISTEALGGASW